MNEQEHLMYAQNLHAFFDAVRRIAQKISYFYHYPLFGSGDF